MKIVIIYRLIDTYKFQKIECLNRKYRKYARVCSVRCLIDAIENPLKITVRIV